MSQKEIYVKPGIELEMFETDDVITASDPDGEGWTGFYPISYTDSSDGR